MTIRVLSWCRSGLSAGFEWEGKESMADWMRGRMKEVSPRENGSPNMAWATIEPSKKVEGRMPWVVETRISCAALRERASELTLVLSMIWSGTTMSPGRTSSRRDPTAEKATIALTPRRLRAAILARALTEEGGME